MIKQFAVTLGLVAALGAPVLSLAQGSSAAASEPTIAEIYQAADNGNDQNPDGLADTDRPRGNPAVEPNIEDACGARDDPA